MNAPIIDINAFAAQVCGIAPAAPGPDLSDLEDFEFDVGNGLMLRCHLKYDEAEDNGDDCRSAKARADLMYAFAGLVDVFDLVEKIPAMKEQIEAEYLASLRKKDADEIAAFNLEQGQKLVEDRQAKSMWWTA